MITIAFCHHITLQYPTFKRPCHLSGAKIPIIPWVKFGNARGALL